MNSYRFDEVEEGMEASFKVRVGEGEVESFSRLTGDMNPLHMDAEYARSTRFGRRVVFGLLAQSYLSALAGMYLPGKYSLILRVESEFRKPAYIGDTLTVAGRVRRKTTSGRLINVDTTITNQSGEVLQTGSMLVQVMM